MQYTHKGVSKMVEVENLDVYSLKGKLVRHKEKKATHEEMRKEYYEKGKITTMHKHVGVLLANSKGRVILQRRSKWKGDNAGLWDKTIGGHVQAGEDFDLTLLKECAQELGIPATIVKEEEFQRAAETTNLHILAIVKKLGMVDNFQSKRLGPDGKTWVEPNISAFYIGYYDGTIWFIDAESCGLQVFTIDELKEEMKKNPGAFTEDVKYMMQKWGHLIKPVEKKPQAISD